MQNSLIVERLQPQNHFYGELPDLLFCEVLALLVVIFDSAQQIALTCVVHHHAIKKSLLATKVTIDIYHRL